MFFFLQIVVQMFPLAEMFPEARQKDLSKEAIKILIFKMAAGSHLGLLNCSKLIFSFQPSICFRVKYRKLYLKNKYMTNVIYLNHKSQLFEIQDGRRRPS